MLTVKNLTKQEFRSNLIVLPTIIKVVRQEFGEFIKLSAPYALTSKVTKLTLLRNNIFSPAYHTKPTPASITEKSVFAKVVSMILNIRMCERLVLRVEMVPLDDFLHVRKW
jgi:hypothetical protein